MQLLERFFRELDGAWRWPAPEKIHSRDLGGISAKLHDRMRMDVDIVANGLPLLPQVPHCRPHPLELQHFEIEVLDVVDVVVSKFKRFCANDVSDIAAMIDLELVPHARWVERIQRALGRAFDFRADDVPRYIANLNRVERDLLDVSESTFELPAWVVD